MVGLYGGAPLEYAGLNEQGSDAVPSSTGQVLGATFGEGTAQNLTPRLLRSIGRSGAETGLLVVGEFGTEIRMEPEAPIDPEAANAEFGIKGMLSFDKPVPRSVAQDLYEHKRAQIEREDTIARREGGLLTGGAARFTTSLAAGILDPVNLAAGFIPVVGEARAAGLIAGAGTAAGRAGVRFGLGGAQGAAGMAALQPLEFGLSRQEHEDYTMAEALRAIALGTVLGGGLHAGTGALLDRATGQYRSPVTQRLEEAGPEARETMLRGALAQTIDGRQVDVAPVLDALPASAIPDAQSSATFTTARGSTYEVHEDGTTTRNKSYHPEHGAADVGLKARSERTIYVDSAAEAMSLSGAGVSGVGPKGHRLVLRDGKATLVWENHETGAWGTAASNRDIPFTTEPAVGKFPVEGWKLADDVPGFAEAYRGQHAGNEIVKVESGKSAEAAPAAVNDLLTSARRGVDAEPAARAEADQAVARPSDALQSIQAEIAELQRLHAPEPAPEVQAGVAARPPEIDIAAETAEARASAAERAAGCISRA